MSVARSAIFSPCRRYRYALTREWATGLVRTAVFIGLNPSTADETEDDPTIRRCIGYAKAWGYGGLCMVNLFALRSTDPRGLYAADDPVGPDNDRYLIGLATGAACMQGIVVAAWGTRGGYKGRDAAVRELLRVPVHVLRFTKSGHPAHPLYLPKSLTPMPWPTMVPA